jgi:hypothetical protein|tara:strand:- start:59 stop:778 length:720 start_codon:yes stop_codon:yes gene_type:complete
METNTILIAIISGLIITTLWTIMLYIYKQNKDKRNFEKETKVELSYMRENLEKKLYEIDNRLTKDNKRWNDVNHLVLDSQKNINFQLDKKQNSPLTNNFFSNMNIDVNNFPVRKDLVFLLTPFHKEFKPVFEKLSITCSSIGLKLMRGDEEFINTSILRYIMQNILQSRIVIVNLDGRNPNVFYELGIAHAIGKPTILITQNLEEVPFDLKDKQLIIYKNLSELEMKLKRSLTQLIINE